VKQLILCDEYDTWEDPDEKLQFYESPGGFLKSIVKACPNLVELQLLLDEIAVDPSSSSTVLIYHYRI
jgi:hypothetical protein